MTRPFITPSIIRSIGDGTRRTLALTALTVLAALAAAAVQPAQAVEPFKVYDTFNGPQIDLTRWVETERVRSLRAGALNLMQRTLGSATADSGLSFVNFNENLVNANAVTALRAKVTVNALEVNACPSNPAIAEARARIVGGFFNVGTPAPGSQLGDAIGQVKVTRFSNSADPAGVLRVIGSLAICTTADCNNANLVGNAVDLGTVSVGQSLTIQIQWDQPGKAFLFGRDNGAFSGSVAYTEADASPPSLAFKQVSTRVSVPACLSAPAVSATVDASFDNIAVNRSAAP